MAKWTKEELQRLEKLYPVMGMKCAPLFGRGEKAVGVQASKHGISKIKHTKESLQATLPPGFRILDYINTMSPMRVIHEECGTVYYTNKPTNHLYKDKVPFKKCPKCWQDTRTAEYIAEIPEEYELVGTLRSIVDKTLHRHKVCGTEWMVKPHDIQNGYGCPACAGKDANKVYLLYFPELNLYKVGISVNPERRARQFGFQADIIWIEEYQDYVAAKAREEEILSKVTKINTGLLKSGNTETFIDGHTLKI